MKASELRLGNYHEYFVEDKVDERQEYWAVGQIDWQDIKIISDRDERFANHPPPNPPKEYYRAIPLTEEWLLKFGFEKDEYNNDRPYYYTFKGFRLNCNLGFLTLYNSNELADFRPIELKYIHQLQNMFFALCGEELELK